MADRLCAIIAAEGVTGTLFFAGAIRLFQVRNEPAEMFNEAKVYTIAACLLAFLVWFFGFMVVAGEWFAMWQSTTWNGQEAAFRFYMAVLGVLIFVNQPDAELPGFVPPRPVTPRRRRNDVQAKAASVASAAADARRTPPAPSWSGIVARGRSAYSSIHVRAAARRKASGGCGLRTARLAFAEGG